MLQGIYGAALAMEAAKQEHEVVAQNLAHLQVPGYRRTQVMQGTFENHVDETRDTFSKRSNSGVRGVETLTDFTPGPIDRTGNMFDFAIDGDGFFELESPDGPVYTRNGAFTLTSEGKLVNQSGYPVRGTAGPIQLDPGALNAPITVDEQGRIKSGAAVVGQVAVVRVEETQQLQRAGTTLFRLPDGVDAEPATVRILSGHLERANVHPVQELVAMIAGQRRHEAAARGLQTLMGAMERHMTLQGGN